MPADFIAADVTVVNIIFEIEVSDGTSMASHSKVVTINKRDNGEAEIAIGRASREMPRTLTASVETDIDGDATDHMYQWEWRGSTLTSAWMEITDANSGSYMIIDDLARRGNEFRIIVTYTDGQGYSKTLESNALYYY